MAKKCGFIALIGKPNVGKSTLLNKLIGTKISITADKPQTTRDRIVGVKTLKNQETQLVFVDTPGLHLKQTNAMNRYMNKTATQAFQEVDVILFLIEALNWSREDKWILNLLSDLTIPVILLINKIDLISNKSELLPMIENFSKLNIFSEIIPFSCKDKMNTEDLETTLANFMPEGPYFYSESEKTDKTKAFLYKEIVREKITRLLGQELPYAVAVEIEKIENKPQVLVLYMIIWVERLGQKKIIIGKKGEQIKEIGRLARIEIEKQVSKKVHLTLWVKIREGWSDFENFVKYL